MSVLHMKAKMLLTAVAENHKVKENTTYNNTQLALKLQ